MSKFYLTTPLYYVNASPHIGHAYTNIIADTLARFKRLKKDKVFFLTGTDEHGEKVKKAADEQSQEVTKFVDEVVLNFKELWEKLNISYDYFIRTTQGFHIQVVQKVIEILREKKDIYKANYRGFYCIPCETFWTETQIKETKGLCPGCQRKVEEIVEENYFFKLSKYENWLKDYLKDNPEFIKPKVRYNEVIGFLEANPLEDLCISRPKNRVSWGIDFPLDSNYVVYVWFDALLNYISGVGYSIDEDRFSFWWPADIHFIGKDILRHHAVFWPIILKALGVSPPRCIFAHGWWKVGEEKMSKSRGNIVNPLELIKEIGVDGLRYFLLREIPVGMDGNFSSSGVINRINSDLANDLGNLVYRTLTMAEKYFEGKVSPLKKDIPSVFREPLNDLRENYSLDMDNVDFPSALERIWRFINVMNKFIEDSKPWELKKNNRIEELEWFLFSLLEGLRIVSIFIYPFMPNSSEKILLQLGKKEEVDLEKIGWQKEGFAVHRGSPLFPRIDVD